MRNEMKNKQSLQSSTLIVATFEEEEGLKNLVLFTDKLVCKQLDI